MPASNAPAVRRSLKIALVTETFPPEVNGVSMSLHRVVENLAALGHQLQVVCPRRTEREHAFDDAGFQILMVPGFPLPRYPELRFGLPAAGLLEKSWRGSRPDLVHVATEGPLGWSAVRAAEKLRIRYFTTFHTNFHTYGRHYGYGFLNRGVLCWLRRIRRNAAATFVPSTGVREELAAAGFSRLSILGRGVDTVLFSPDRRDEHLRTQWGASPATPVALYVGRIAREKNIPLAVRAFREMRITLPDLRMVLVGDGPARSEIQAALPDAVFAGMRRGEDLARHYASGDVFIFPSVTETFGNVMTEAMASGLVVLSYDYAAARDHIRDGVDGRVVPFGNESAYIAAARDLAARRRDWPDLGRAARATAEKLSWRKIVERFADELQELAAPPS